MSGFAVIAKESTGYLLMEPPAWLLSCLTWMGTLRIGIPELNGSWAIPKTRH